MKYAPKGSSFFDKFIIPALNPDPKIREVAIPKRDQQLMRLLTAAHTANGLKKVSHFSVRPELRADQWWLHHRNSFAKVVISNQSEKARRIVN